MAARVELEELSQPDDAPESPLSVAPPTNLDIPEQVVVKKPPKKHVTRYMMIERLNKSCSIIDNDLHHPWGVAVNKKGDIIVAEFNRHCISVFSPKGEHLFSFGQKGSGEGQFNCPTGVAVDVQDNIVVADYKNHRVQKFSPNGTFIKAVGQQGDKSHDFNCPVGVAIHPFSGNVYVVDNKNHRIQVLSSDLSYSFRFSQCGHGDGQLFYPWDVAFDGEGKLYVADGGNHCIQVFEPRGKFLRKFGKEGGGAGELSWPSGVFVDYDNVVYVTEDGNNCFSTFTTAGHYLTSVGKKGERRAGGDFNSPKGVVVDDAGTVILSDSNHNLLQLY